MPNKNGNSYSLTALFPVKDEVTGTTTAEDSLREFLADLPRGSNSPFAKDPVTHFTRFVVIDKLGFNGEPSLPDPLGSPYLLWTACFNGDLEPWLAAIWNGACSEIEVILSYCAHYDAYHGRDGFVRYVKRGQIRTSFPFADYPNATVEEVLDGLKLKKHFVGFMVENQRADAMTLQTNFLAWMEKMAQHPSPRPGSTY